MESASSGKRRIDVNPFWSERIRGEAILRSLRPKSLPPAVERGRGREGRGLPAMALKARPEEDEAQENRPRGSMNVESVMALVLQQNSELQKEVFALPMATGGFPPVCMVPPPFCHNAPLGNEDRRDFSHRVDDCRAASKLDAPLVAPTA